MPANRGRTDAAVANNAELCDLVCGLHGVATARTQGFWMAQGRPPTWYPDAMSLRPDTSAASVATLIGERARCSVKDSYADLDLTDEGFDVLFTATWIYREPARRAAMPTSWAVVESPDALAQWSAVHGSSGTFPAAVLADPSIRFLVARRDEQVVAGAIANRSADVVGLSNVFTTESDPAAAWSDVGAAVAACFPDVPVVGYEHGNDLRRAVATGFAETGELRVWLRGT